MIILYFFDKNRRPLTQIFGVLSCSIREALSDVSTAEIELSTRTPDGAPNKDIKEEFFREMNIVEIWKNDWQKEEKMFEGYISSVVASWESVKISLRDFLGILEYRILKNSKKFDGTTAEFLLENLWSEMADNPLTLECNAPDLVKKDYEIGRTILDILKDISTAGYEFRLEWNTVKFGKDIGADRSDRVVYRKEWFAPNEWNISEVKSEYHAGNTHNFVLTKIASSPPYSVQDDASIAKYGRKEKYISVSGDERTTPAWYLAERKESSREISITPADNNFTHISVGDRIGVFIDSGNDILHFQWSLKISEKNYIHGDLDEVKLVVATSSAKSMSLMEKIKSLDTRVSNVENKN